MGSQTDEIFEDIINDTSNENNIDFVEENAARKEIREAVEAQYPSLSQFASECGIHPSHLSDFFNKGKNLGRNNALAVLINLHYDFKKIQTMLQRLHLPILYVRNKRDYQIAKGIQKGKTLNEIEEILQAGNMESIM